MARAMSGEGDRSDSHVGHGNDAGYEHKHRINPRVESPVTD